MNRFNKDNKNFNKQFDEVEFKLFENRVEKELTNKGPTFSEKVLRKFFQLTHKGLLKTVDILETISGFLRKKWRRIQQ